MREGSRSTEPLTAYTHYGKGLLQGLAGTLSYVASPLTGAADFTVGRPVEMLTTDAPHGSVLGLSYDLRMDRQAAGDIAFTMATFGTGNSVRASTAASRVALSEAQWSSIMAARTPLIADVRAISAAEANAPFLARGLNAPYSNGSQVRTFTTSSELTFVRVTTDRPQSAWLARADEIASMTPEQIQVHLALPKVPTHILDVVVSARTRMQVGFVAAQPSFGVTGRGGLQYQLLQEIPASSFGPMRPIP